MNSTFDRKLLLTALRDIYNQTPDKNVVIKADRRLKYAEVRKIMKMINQAGFPGVGLETHKKGVPAA